MKKYAIIDYRTNVEIVDNLEKNGFSIIKSYENKNVYESISGHVDISLFFSGDICEGEENKRFFVASKESYSYYREIFDKYDIKIPLYKGKNSLEKKYPLNVIYNACFSGDSLICNFDYVDEVICELLDSYQKINVKQGYSNCSILCLDSNNFITSDNGIYKSLIHLGKNVLKIEEGYIDLDGLNYGFIGGVSGIFDNTVYFTGNIETHINAIEIKKFIQNNGKKIVNLSNGNLYDYGGMYLFD